MPGTKNPEEIVAFRRKAEVAGVVDLGSYSDLAKHVGNIFGNDTINLIG